MATYQRTAEMPLMDELSVKLLEALDNNGSYLELALMFPDLIDALTSPQNHGIAIKETVGDFEAQDFLEMSRLLQYIHKDVLRSILAGTVARDFQSANPPKTYSAKICGTYICSMSIEGRGGKFLSNNEIDRLCGSLRFYAEAAKEWLEKGCWDSSIPRTAAYKAHVIKIDAQHPTPKHGQAPLYIDNISAMGKVQMLADMFESRRDHQLDFANNGDTYHAQAPCMVGCTGLPIQESVKAHEPNVLESTTYTWALTISALSSLGLNPIVTAVPVIRTCEQNDLALSERLVTVLARSMVFQTGFNVIQGGGERDTRPRGYAEQNLVLVESPAVFDNMNRTLARIKTLRRDVEIERHLRACNVERLPILQDRMETAVIAFTRLVDGYVEAREKLRAQVAKKEANNEKMRKQIAALRAEKRLQEAVANSRLGKRWAEKCAAAKSADNPQ